MQGAVAPLEIIFGGAHKIQEFRRSITHFNAQPCTAPAQQIISFTSSQLAVPPGLMGCQVAEWLVSPIPLQGPKSLICLENNIESKSRSWADIRETSYKQKVFQKMFSQQHDVHFGSQGEGTALTLVHTCSSTGFSTVQLSTRMCVSAQTQAKRLPRKPNLQLVQALDLIFQLGGFSCRGCRAALSVCAGGCKLLVLTPKIKTRESKVDSVIFSPAHKSTLRLYFFHH